MPINSETKPSVPLLNQDIDPEQIRRMRERLRRKQQRVVSTPIENVPGVHATITAEHDTTLGSFNKRARPPYGTSLGGFRVVDGSTADPARLAQLLAGDMTRKWAILYRMLADMYHQGKAKDYEVHAAGMGGSKSALVVDDAVKFAALRESEAGSNLRRSVMWQHGLHIYTMDGPITAVDMGTGQQDMDWVSEVDSLDNRIRFVACQSPKNGGVGDPSRVTAAGVSHSVIKMMELKEIKPENAVVAIQGVGHVGYNVLDILHTWQPGMQFRIADLDRGKADQLAQQFNGAVQVDDPQNIFYAPADIIVPAAGPEILTIDVLNGLDQRVQGFICAANDPWPMREGEPDPDVVRAYFNKGVTVPPAYLTNAGGIGMVSTGYWRCWGGPTADEARAMELIAGVGPMMDVMYGLSLTGSRPMEEIGQDTAAETILLFARANHIDIPV